MAEYTVSRSTTIDAPAERIHALIDDLHSWQQWSPWEGLDDNLTRSYTGAERGVGAHYEWQGNRKAGRGSMQIAASAPDEVSVDVAFLKPFRSTSVSRFTLEPLADATLVTWTMTGQQSGLMGLFGKVVSMDSLMGKDFEKGLAQLKTVAERA